MMNPDFRELRFQLLSCQISIGYEDLSLGKSLSYMTVAARQDVDILTTLTYTVRGLRPYELYEEGALFARVNSAEDLLFHVYRCAYRRVLERYMLAGWVAWHAGMVRIAGKRLMLLGEKGAGKSTLATRLLFAGHEFEGDELVLSQDRRLLPIPRRLHLKPGISQQVPELSRHLPALPGSRSADQTVRALDPTSLGFAWRISAGPVDGLISISPNHGGSTDIQSIGPFAMVQKVIESCQGWGGSKRTVVKSAAKLGEKGGYKLTLGNANEAVAVLERLAESGMAV